METISVTYLDDVRAAKRAASVETSRQLRVKRTVRIEPLAWVNGSETLEVLFFCVFIIVFDVVWIFLALWLANQPFMGGPLY